jgi:hypothetical protein
LSNLLRSCLRCALLGAGVATVLALAGARPWLARAPVDVDAGMTVGRVVGAALWLHVLARLRFAAATRTRIWGFGAVLGSTAAVVVLTSALSALLTVLSSRALGVATPLGAAVRTTLEDGVLLSLLASCLFETLREPRALVTAFVALSWVLPALLAGSVPDPTGKLASGGPQSLFPRSWPFVAAGSAVVTALLALRPRVETE